MNEFLGTMRHTVQIATRWKRNSSMEVFCGRCDTEGTVFAWIWICMECARQNYSSNLILIILLEINFILSFEYYYYYRDFLLGNLIKLY